MSFLGAQVFRPELLQWCYIMHTEPYGMLFLFYSLFKPQQHCKSLMQKLGAFLKCYSEHTLTIAVKSVWDLKAHRGKIWCRQRMCPGCHCSLVPKSVRWTTDEVTEGNSIRSSYVMVGLTNKQTNKRTDIICTVCQSIAPCAWLSFVQTELL